MLFAKVDLSVHPPVLREEVIANDLEDHRSFESLSTKCIIY